jgi:uncharacterized protein DUF1553/uncharacterized protein DUF1549
MRWVGMIAAAVLSLGVSAGAAPARKAPARKAPARKAPAKAARPAPSTPAVTAPQHPQFLRDIAPILDKQGCSVAACHGKFGGRGDFAISLLTLAPEDDYAPIVYGARGRRVNLQEPEQSLLLLKAVAQVPHGGGMRFKKGSVEYQTLLNWLKDGAPFAQEDARLQTLTVEPARVVSKVGQVTPLKVSAKWSDGRVEDVTQKAVYASADEPVAAVSGEGKVTGVRWGGTAIQVRYLGTVRAAFFTLPQVRKGPASYPETPRANLIDNLVFDNLKKMNVLPSGLTTDEQFCRRVYLDLLGVLPTPEELEAFLAECAAERQEAAQGNEEMGKRGNEGKPISSFPSISPFPSKTRAKLIDALLERPEFVDLRTLRIADLLRLNPRKISNNNGFGERSVVLFHEWIRENVAKNRPYNEFVKELLSARGSLYFNGPASYWAVERTANDRAETTGQAFLGVRLQCARCHKHPFDRWTTDDYWDFSSFHGKVGLRNVPGGAFGEQEVYYNAGANVVNQSVNGPRKGLPALPTFLGAEPLGEEQLKGDISQQLSEWVVSKENPFFARSTMNRLWSNYFGRGLIHPVDDMRETTPESVPGMLDALAKEFVEHGYDIKHMIRLMLNSRAYQLSSAPNDSNALDDRFYSHYYPKPMPAQVLLDTINQATGTAERLTAFPLTRSVELPVPTNNYFLTIFGKSHREYLTDLDPKLEPNLVQTLHMMNSGYVNQKIRSGTYIRDLGRAKMEDEALVRQAFLRTLCRQPTAEETAAALKALSQAKNRQEGIEDLLWALIASREFLFIS